VQKATGLKMAWTSAKLLKPLEKLDTNKYLLYAIHDTFKAKWFNILLRLGAIAKSSSA
jgi:hypothetical protein